MMSAPRRIQFTTSGDGVSLAYWETGSGPPLVVMHNFGISHAELEWEVPGIASFLGAVADHHRVIRFDPRDTGLSGRGTGSPMVEEVMGDLEAVAGACGLGSFALLAVQTMAPVAVAFAAANPERVTHLVLCEPDVTVASSEGHAQAVKGQIALAESGTSQLISSLWARLAPPEDVAPLIALVTANTADAEGQARSGRAIIDWDAAPLLSAVSTPTLILHAKSNVAGSITQAREAAAVIPNAQLTTVDGGWAPYFADQSAVLAAMSEFLGWATHHTEVVPRPVTESVSTVVFTDMVSSTEVLEQLGDEAARAALRSVENVVGEAARAHSGRVVKHLGDGSLVEFASVSDALNFAIKVQTELARGELQARIGMAAGEPIREDGDLHGAVVVMASRITNVAGPTEVCLSDGVRHLVAGKGYEFDDLGERTLKGFDEPARVWRLRMW